MIRLFFGLLAGGFAMMGAECAGSNVSGPEACGKTGDNVPVEVYTMKNAAGMTARLMTRGATLIELDVPDDEAAGNPELTPTRRICPDRLPIHDDCEPSHMMNVR